MNQIMKELHSKYPELSDWTAEEVVEFSLEYSTDLLNGEEGGERLNHPEYETEEFQYLFFKTASIYLNGFTKYRNITPEIFLISKQSQVSVKSTSSENENHVSCGDGRRDS